MATEFSPSQLAEFSAQNGHGYETLVTMAPYWRSFLLDETDKARLEMVRANTRSHATDTYYSFVAKVSGIDIEQIEAVCETGDFITVVPTSEVYSFQQFLSEKFPTTT